MVGLLLQCIQVLTQIQIPLSSTFVVIKQGTCHAALTRLVVYTVLVTINQCIPMTDARICIQTLAIVVIIDRINIQEKKTKEKTETLTLLLNGIIFLCWTTTMDFKAIVINRITKSKRVKKNV